MFIANIEKSFDQRLALIDPSAHVLDFGKLLPNDVVIGEMTPEERRLFIFIDLASEESDIAIAKFAQNTDIAEDPLYRRIMDFEIKVNFAMINLAMSLASYSMVKRMDRGVGFSHRGDGLIINVPQNPESMAAEQKRIMERLNVKIDKIMNSQKTVIH